MQTKGAKQRNRDTADDGMLIDELAAMSSVPVRTIREYQTLGLLPAPQRRGRVAIYRPSHLLRLRLIARLQARGYSLSGIGDLLSSWQEGDDLSDVLGLDADELVHVDEPGAYATEDQLRRMVPKLYPDHTDDLLELRLIEQCGPDRFCVPSPSLLQLAVLGLRAGFEVRAVLGLLRVVHDTSDEIARTVVSMLTGPSAPKGRATTELARRGRGLLAHAAGRMTIHAIGRQLAEHPDFARTESLQRLLRKEEP